MTEKINLIYSNSDWIVFNQPWLEPIVKKWFNLVEVGTVANSSPVDSLVITNCLNYPNETSWANQYINNGYRVVVDNLWENLDSDYSTEQIYVLQNKNWFWYNESLWYKFLKNDSYSPNKTYNKLALMQINREKPWRTEIFKKLDPMLDSLIYSYVELSKYLPHDGCFDDGNWQRRYNPIWYDDTYFSIIIETTIDNEEPFFITEKTFKSAAFWHPYVVFGQTGILQYMKKCGFETFENLFDESYDTIEDTEPRIESVIKNIKNFDKVHYDQLTLKKLKHNYYHFYNCERNIRCIEEEILKPLLEYAETR